MVHLSIVSNVFRAFSLPWIPFEYHNKMEDAKRDFKAEVWAYATTMWEIFSRGKSPTLQEVSWMI